MNERLLDLTLIKNILTELEVDASKYKFDFEIENAKNMKLLAEIKLYRMIREERLNLNDK